MSGRRPGADHNPAMRADGNSFKGNKQALPAKPCAACGRDMVWRRAWAKNWAEVKFCSQRCRQRGAAGPGDQPAG